MKVHYGIDSLKEIKNPIITVGTFDGVHLGHQKIIERLKKLANNTHGETVLLTFEPHPRKVLFKNQTLKLINTLEEKINLLDTYGLDHLVIYPFTQEFSNLSARSYIEELLIKKLKTHTLVIGYDHHFGNDRQGNIELLKKVKNDFRKILRSEEFKKEDQFINILFDISSGNDIDAKILSFIADYKGLKDNRNTIIDYVTWLEKFIK